MFLGKLLGRRKGRGVCDFLIVFVRHSIAGMGIETSMFVWDSSCYGVEFGRCEDVALFRAGNVDSRVIAGME